jgi:hypothetical protein
VDNRTYEQLGQINTRLNSIDKTLTEQAADLKHHIKRTDLAEANLALLREDVKPLKRAYTWAEGVLKAIGLLAVVLAILKSLDLL